MHKQKMVDSFSKKYNLTKLVYYELYSSSQEAVAREKQIKAGSRKRKNFLVEGFNPEWKDLYDEVG